MSMRDHSINDYGLLLTEETMHCLANKLCSDFSEEKWELDSYDFIESVKDKISACCAVEFTGKAYMLDNAGFDKPYNFYDFVNEIIFYLPINPYASLFKATYGSMDEIIAEFKEKLGKYLPDDFNYRPYIMHFTGTHNLEVN